MFAALIRRPWIALYVALVAQAVLAVLAQGDYTPADPIWYAQIARDISIDPSGTFAHATSHPFFMRVGLTLPLAALYRLLGASPFVTTLPAVISALVIMGVVYVAAPTPRAKLVGLVLVLVSPAVLEHAAMLTVDFPAAAPVAVSILCLARRASPRRAIWLAAAMATWFFAFLVKETALWCAPIWMYAAVADVRAEGKQILRSYLPAFGVGLVLGVLYLVICAHVWGTPFARFIGVQELTGVHAWSMTEARAAAWTERLTYGPALLLAKVFLASLVPLIAAPWVVKGNERIWWVSALVLIAMYWFGSTSVTAYAPLPLLPRMVIAALPPLVVTAAIATDALFDRLSKPGSIALALILIVPGAWQCYGFTRRPRPETAAIEVAAAAARDHRVVVVCGDPRCSALVTFTLGFAPPPTMTIQFAPEFAAAPSPPARTMVFAFVNLRRKPAAEWYDPARDPKHYEIAKITQLGLPVIVGMRNVRLYGAGDGQRLWAALQ